MTAAVYRLSSLHHKPNKCLQKRLSNLGSIVQVLWKQHKSLTTLNRSYSRGQMSLGQFQESFLIGAFYSCHHYYYPKSTLTPPPPPPPDLRQCWKALSKHWHLFFLGKCLFNTPSSTLFWGKGRIGVNFACITFTAQHFSLYCSCNAIQHNVTWTQEVF